jgi:hypothetical protein
MTTTTLPVTSETLVEAWEERRYIDEVDYEREAALIVRLPDGRFFTTGFRPLTPKVRDNFGIDSDRWTAIDPIQVYKPEAVGAAPRLVVGELDRKGTDWIGRYRATPALIKAANAPAQKAYGVTLDQVFTGRFLKA